MVLMQLILNNINKTKYLPLPIKLINTYHLEINPIKKGNPDKVNKIKIKDHNKTLLLFTKIINLFILSI